MKVVSIGTTTISNKVSNLDFTLEKIIVKSSPQADLNLSKEHEKLITIAGRMYRMMVPAEYDVPVEFVAKVTMKDGTPLVDITSVMTKIPSKLPLFQPPVKSFLAESIAMIGSFISKDLPFKDRLEFLKKVGLDFLPKKIKSNSIDDTLMSSLIKKDPEILKMLEMWAISGSKIKDENHDILYFQIPYGNKDEHTDEYIEFTYEESRIGDSKKVVLKMTEYTVEVNMISGVFSIKLYSKSISNEGFEEFKSNVQGEGIDFSFVGLIREDYRHHVRGDMHSIDNYV